MADNDLKPVDDLAATTIDTARAEASKLGDATQALKDGATKLGAQATEKVRHYADEGKARAGGALDQIAQLLTDAAGTVDEKLGDQYGHYARSAAGSVSNFADSLKAKDVDELIDDARDFVRKSPAVAIGIAAAVGFALARVVQSGVDGTDANKG